MPYPYHNFIRTNETVSNQTIECEAYDVVGVDIPRMANIAKHVQPLNLVMSLECSIHHEVANHYREHHSRLHREMVNMNPETMACTDGGTGIERTNLDITSSRSDLGISTRRRKLGEECCDAVCCPAQEQLARGWRPVLSVIVKRPGCGRRTWLSSAPMERNDRGLETILNSSKSFVYVS